jgi:hypothetical protein
VVPAPDKRWPMKAMAMSSRRWWESSDARCLLSGSKTALVLSDHQARANGCGVDNFGCCLV